MKRRALLFAGSALLAAPLLHAQGTRPKHRIGVLWPSNAEDGKIALQSFHSKLRALDQIEGRDYATEARFADGKPEQLPALARELAALRPDVAREVLPGMRRVALLLHEKDPVSLRVAEQYQKAAAAMKLDLDVIPVTRAEDLERAAAQAVRSRADVLVVPALTFFILHAGSIAEAAAKARLPLIGSFSRVASRGGLLSHYSDLRESYYRAAILVDKILKGGKPAEIPVEQPDRFLLVINLRTAKALGITIPRHVLARADEVIE